MNFLTLLTLDQLTAVKSFLRPWDRIFLSWDLWAGKTTLTGAILRSHFGDAALIVKSPTYTYWREYPDKVYHVDLYRIESYEELFLTGVLDLIADPESICIIEWSEKLALAWHFEPTLAIMIEKTQEPMTRQLQLSGRLEAIKIPT